MIEKLKSLGLEVDYELEGVESIYSCGEHQTYDMTVPEIECFSANGFLVHNSGSLEEHSDLVFLLHWDWFYNRDDSTKKNDYSIIVAKNKQTGKTFKHDCYFYPQYFKISEVPLEGEHTEYAGEK